MLQPSQFQQWCQRLQLPPATCDLIARLRTAPPARRVQSRAHNVSGRYPSRKMGATIQFEKVFQSCGYATLSQRKRHTNTE
jgi:putative transposase